MADSEKKSETVFLIEEYKNIAATHDKLRDLLVRLFNYFLLLSAFPFTVAGIVFRSGGFNLFAAPGEIRILFLFVALGDLCLAVALFDARLSQYRYARTRYSGHARAAPGIPGRQAPNVDSGGILPPQQQGALDRRLYRLPARFASWFPGGVPCADHQRSDPSDRHGHNYPSFG